MALAHVAGTRELAGVSGRPWKSNDQRSQTATSSATSSRFYVPAVHIPAEAAKAGPVHKIHILGDDARSRFIAHALCGVYNSVELMGMRTMPKSRYRNIDSAPSPKTRHVASPVRNAAVPQKEESRAKDNESHIEELIVTGRGYEAVEAIKSIKHRVDENTSITLMNDGMGVLEDVREEVFKGTKKEPNLILGHMSHSLVYNRKTDSAKQLKGGRTLLTRMPSLWEATENSVAPGLGLEQQPAILETLQQLGKLRVSYTTYDDWLRSKLPSMVFTAVVEPICVLLDVSYQDLVSNQSARRMLNQLVDELILVLENLPEVQESAQILAYLRSNSIRKLCYQKIMAKASAPSDLVVRLRRGLDTDITYQNGYFLRRAKQLGLPLPMNQFMAHMVTAKHEEILAKRSAWVPVVEKSHADQNIKEIRRALSV